jgi:hypothetical protein
MLYRNFGKVPGFESCNEDLTAILGKDFSPEERTVLPGAPATVD